MTFRILYPNGASKVITVLNHTIPPDSFCFTNDILEDFTPSKRMILLESIPNHILLVYSIITDEILPLVYGMMIDWDGNITR